MNQVKIGKFIAECRKKNNLTQMQLAEKLNITDRAISKWENGKAMPDSSIMLELCAELKISVNELLSGEVLEMNSYNEKMEQNLIDMVRQKEASDKRLLKMEIVIGVLIMIPFAIRIEQTAGYYECQKCHHKYIPTFSSVLWAMHINRTRYMKCPKCNQRSWQKKVITKE